jgi:predicted glycosyltransferase
MHLEIARLELRSIPDCKDKYESIEKMPHLIDEVQVSVQNVSRRRDNLCDIDTKKLNKSGILLSFQSMDGDIQVIEDDATSIEQETLELLKRIREAGTSRKAGLI